MKDRPRRLFEPVPPPDLPPLDDWRVTGTGDDCPAWPKAASYKYSLLGPRGWPIIEIMPRCYHSSSGRRWKSSGGWTVRLTSRANMRRIYGFYSDEGVRFRTARTARDFAERLYQERPEDFPWQDPRWRWPR